MRHKAIVCVLHSDVLLRSFLYILAPNSTQIQVMSLNAPGQGKNLQNLDMASVAKAAGLKLSTNMQGMTAFIKA